MIVPINKITKTRYFFIFPPIHGSSGKTYRFSLNSPSLPGTGICLWHSTENSYKHGGLIVNNQSQPGSLFFTAYGFTGTAPRTIWEGIREAAIRQGEYITVRELQLYVELNQELREQSPTEKKLLRMKEIMIK